MGESYTYECTRGHEVESTRPVSRCPGFTRGQPCAGDLHAIGEGSQAENRRLKELRDAAPAPDPKTQPKEKKMEATTAPADTPAQTPDPPAALPGLVAVPLPRATTVAVEALELSLGRIPDHKSKVVDGVLHLEPAERDAVDQATRDHARELLAVNRAANSYRDVLLREIRKAIAAVVGGAPAPAKKKPAPAKKAAPKKSPAKKAAAPKKAPAKPAPAKRASTKAPAKKASASEVEPRFKEQKAS